MVILERVISYIRAVRKNNVVAKLVIYFLEHKVCI